MAAQKSQNNDDDFQKSVATAIALPKGPSSIGDLLGDWAAAIDDMLSDPFAAIAKAGGCVEEFCGAFVPPDPEWQNDVEVNPEGGEEFANWCRCYGR